MGDENAKSDEDAKCAAAAVPAAPAEGVRLLFAPTGGPHAAELVEVARLFRHGDFGGARPICRRVVAGSCTDEERAFAREILHRTGIDPLAIAIGAIALVLLVVVALANLSCWGH